MRTRNLITTAVVVALLVIGLAAAALGTTGGERGERDRDRVTEQVEVDDAGELMVRERDRDRLHVRDGDGTAAHLRQRDREHARDVNGTMARMREHRETRERDRAPAEDGARSGEGTARQYHERGCATHPVRQCPAAGD